MGLASESMDIFTSGVNTFAFCLAQINDKGIFFQELGRGIRAFSYAMMAFQYFMYMIFILTASKWWSKPPSDIHIHAAINASIKFISGDTSDYISGQVNNSDIQGLTNSIYEMYYSIYNMNNVNDNLKQFFLNNVLTLKNNMNTIDKPIDIPSYL